MIGSISGKVLDIDGVTVLIETASGVGYEVEVPGNILTSIKVGEPCFLFVQHIVREDAELLYGFESKEARLIFREVNKVNGIGPRIALALLSVFDAPSFIDAINQGRVDLLVATPGIGKKTAERLIVEMKDRIAKLRLSERFAAEGLLLNPPVLDESKDGALTTNAVDTINALVSLGFKEAQVTAAVKAIYDDSKSVEEMLVEGLAYLTNGKR